MVQFRTHVIDMVRFHLLYIITLQHLVQSVIFIVYMIVIQSEIGSTLQTTLMPLSLKLQLNCAICDNLKKATE